jgi:hypothetical protein
MIEQPQQKVIAFAENQVIISIPPCYSTT